MKKLIVFIFLFHIIHLQAQIDGAQKCVEDFFEAFHLKDTIALKSLLTEDVVIKTVVNKNDTTSSIKSESVNNFLNAIASVPDEVNFFEKIDSFSIEEDGALAHIWTPYSFYVNDELIHTGINSFTLVKLDSNNWKIIHLIDTRIIKPKSK